MRLASRNVKPTAGDGLERQRDADGITDEPWVWNPLGSVSSATPPARHWGISQHPGPGSASLKRPTEYLFAKFALVSGWHLGLAAGDHARHASCTKVLTRRHVLCPNDDFD